MPERKKKTPKKTASTAAPSVISATFADITPHENNANGGTERGNYMLTESVQSGGIGRGIVLDKNKKIIGGNHIHAKAGELGFDNVVIVPTKGDTLVATMRVDCDLDAEPGSDEYVKAHTLAIADNRTSEVNNNWVSGSLDAYSAGGVDLDVWFKPVELDSIFSSVATPPEDLSIDEGSEDGGDRSGGAQKRQQPAGMKTPLAIALTSAELKRWKGVKERLGIKGDSKAFVALIEELEGD